MALLVARIWAVLRHSFSVCMFGSSVVQLAVAVAWVPSGVCACTVNIHVMVVSVVILCFSMVLLVIS